MYSKIFEIIQTKEDLNLLLDEIDLLKAGLYQAKIDSFESALNNSVRVSTASVIREELVESKSDPKKYLEGLQEFLKNVTEIKIQVAYEPTARGLSAIREWVAKNIAEFVVLDLYYNPNIVGGAAISFKGKYYDGTLSKKLQETNSKRQTL